MNPTYKVLGNKLTFSFPYSKEIVEDLKSIEWKDRKYDPISKTWTIIRSLVNQNQVKRIIEKHGFSLEKIDSDAVSTEDNISLYIKNKSRLGLVKSYRDEIDKIQSIIIPKEFQYSDIDVMCSWPRMINGNDMGCISGEMTIQVNRSGVGFPIKLKDLYRKFNRHFDRKSTYIWSREIDTYCKCLDEERNIFIKNKIKEIKMNKEDYDELPVVACKYCDHLNIQQDDVENAHCIKCGAINELREFKNIQEYLNYTDAKRKQG